MNRKDVFWFGLATTAMAWALGCGSDDPGNPPVVTTLEVRNGTWAIAETSSYSGDDSCLARGQEALDTTDVICSKSLIEADPDFPVQCTITQIGDAVTFDCNLRVDLGICTQIIRFDGGGTVTDTTFNMVFDVTQQVIPKDSDNAETCELFYGRFVDDCILTVHSVGSWVDSTGSFTCPSDTLSSAAFPMFLPEAFRFALGGN